MFIRNTISSLALPLLFSTTLAYDLDTKSTDSIKSTAKTLADGIVKLYQANPEGSPIGIFNGKDGGSTKYFWWEAGAVWNAMVEYAYLTGDTAHNGLVSDALVAQLGDYNAFMPANQTKTLGNDDQSYWGLAALSAAEVGLAKPKDNTDWIDMAKAVFDTQTMRWDNETCKGGLRWQIFTFNAGYNYKNAVTTAQFFALSARLARFTGNQTHSEWADKAFTWLKDSGLMTKDYAVFDGADSTTNCSQINHIQWSNNQGIMLEGAAVMYNLTSDDKWKSAVTSLVNASSVFISKTSSNVLTEVACENNGKCNTDQKAFKGIAARSLSRAALSAPFISDTVQKVIEASAKGAAGACDGTDKELGCGFKWDRDNDDVSKLNEDGLSEVLGAMNVVQALLWPQAKALTGQGAGAKANATATPTPSASGSGKGGAGPTATGTGEGAKSTGAAGRTEVAWGVVGLAAGVIAMGL
ncbi:glycosyl hydrolase family 76-domain-containing protein [Clohesyomyces aquaticus]|uniref:Mannan endo-1,6-alpha-mannosidase n=1 Tax=Clohesyomyces aquaticus TaxID=1231657 RepID=A0A1Y1ZWC2_9PLEO|nr:glycosyl hydrolase family 76-domain-containing protein [Clohesyomyces aquaticus]